MNRILNTPILIAALVVAFGFALAGPLCSPIRAELPKSPPMMTIEDVDTPAAEAPEVPSRPLPRSEQTPRLLPALSEGSKQPQAALTRVEQAIRRNAELRSHRLQDLKDQLDALLLVTGNNKPVAPPASDPSLSSPDSDEEATKPAANRTPGSSQTPVPQASPVLTPLTTSPIDRLALANNLFAAGQYGLSLESYKQLNPETMQPSDRRWARYQAACCYRKLGNSSQAESIYRELASEVSDDFVGTQARWWLDRVQKRQRLENSLKGLDESLQALEVRARTGGGSPVPTGTTRQSSPSRGGSES